MRKKLRTIIEELGQRTYLRKELASDLERLSDRLALYHIHLGVSIVKEADWLFQGDRKTF